jgi:hypothetical protein
MLIFFMISDKYSKKQLAAGAAFLLFLVGVAVFAYFSSVRKSALAPVLPFPKNAGLFSAPSQRSGEPSPAQALDLSNWKLTLPVTTPGDPSRPLDVLQPELATFQMSPWFALTPDKKGVIFRAPVNAPTTANSDYPRSELREMTDGGIKEAFWPSKTGVHTLLLDEAITAVPKNKPEVVAGQIHGDDDDLITVRLDFPKLYLARSKSNLATLDEKYTLGRRFIVKFVASDGQIKVYYNNSSTPVYALNKKVNQAYFKAGVYTQSNCETEDSSNLCTSDNYGEVVVYQAVVTHQ